MHTSLKDGLKGSKGGVEAGLHEDRVVCVGGWATQDSSDLTWD